MHPRGPLRHLRRHGHHLGGGHGSKFGHGHGHRHGKGCGPRHGHGHGFGHHGRHGKYFGCGLGLQQCDSGPKHGGVKKGHGNMRCHGKFLRDLLSRVEVVDTEAGSPCWGTRDMHPHARPHYESEGPHHGREESQHGQTEPHHGHGGPHPMSGRHHHGHGRPHHGRGRYGPGRHHHGPTGPFLGIGRPHPHGECTGCKHSQKPDSDSQGVEGQGQGEPRPVISNGRRLRRKELFNILREILRDGPCGEQHNIPNTPTIPPPNTNEPIIGNRETSAPSNVIEQSTKTQGKGDKV